MFVFLKTRSGGSSAADKSKKKIPRNGDFQIISFIARFPFLLSLPAGNSTAGIPSKNKPPPEGGGLKSFTSSLQPQL